MKSKNLMVLVALLVFLAVGSAAMAQVSIEYLGTGSATAISGDGSVIVGNSYPDYETFRWTRDTGTVLLGRGTHAVFGTGAGGPDVSDDGNFVSATITGGNDTYITVGRWNPDTGWEETMPPPPPGGGIFDNAYGSAWGISDDGSTVTGLFWLPEGNPFAAHGLAWNTTDGAMDMGATVGNSRVNDANADGSVLVGWDEAPFGTWMPTVWENGELHHLTETSSWCLANCVTPDGNMIGGSTANENDVRVAAIWIREGENWQEYQLGALPGVGNPFGQAIVNDISDDGTMMVGYNAWDPGYSTGFIYTLQNGLMAVDDFLEDQGITVDPGLRIASLTGISGDGKHICGIATQTVYPWGNESFIIHLEDPLSATPSRPDMASILEPNYPNPFNPETVIPVNLEREGSIRLEVHDATGKRVRTLHQGFLMTGRHEFTWNGRNEDGRQVASGVYFSRLTDASGQSTGRRMVLVK